PDHHRPLCSIPLDRRPGAITRMPPMLHYAVVFFVIAVIAALLGFSGIAGAATNIAWILFVVFLVLGAISLLRGRRVSSEPAPTGRRRQDPSTRECPPAAPLSYPPHRCRPARAGACTRRPL